MLDRVDTVYLAAGVTDLRKSTDGLSVIVQEHFRLDPFSRHFFVFCNRKKDKIKMLEWGGGAGCLVAMVGFAAGILQDRFKGWIAS